MTRVSDEQIAEWRVIGRPNQAKKYDLINRIADLLDALESERARADVAESQVSSTRRKNE